jgi:4-diphosphocytidyl-2-C-methyl-D-erythritol kinase
VELALRDEPGIALSVEGGGPEVPADARNLAWRAAEALLARLATPRGVAIRLVKRVPSGAGLGGGSSDAGAVLRGLAALVPGAASLEALREVALGLGADVPFFLDPQPAEVRGIGERIAPAGAVPRLPLVVVHPGVALGTKEVYAAYAARARGSDDTSHRRPPSVPARPELLAAADWAARVANDLEVPAVGLCPRIGTLLGELRALGALAAGMSGSGSAVYGVFADAASRDAAARRVRVMPGERSFATATVASR